jgi:serine/threonine protein phosphatase PrpC
LEDRVLVVPEFFSPDISLCGVFDGHSGNYVSDFVSSSLPNFLLQTPEMRTLLQLVKPNKHIVPIETVAKLSELALRKAFLRLDHVLLQQLTGANQQSIASTAVATFLYKNLLTVAHLGNSRACIFRGMPDGSITPQWLTTDHSPVQPEEHRRIISRGGVVGWKNEKARFGCPEMLLKPRSKKLNYSRGFGGRDLKSCGFIADPEVHHYEILPNDKFLVLATDGLWDILTPGYVAHIIATARASGLCATSEIMRTVIEEMPDLSIQDNVSVVVVDL